MAVRRLEAIAERGTLVAPEGIFQVPIAVETRQGGLAMEVNGQIRVDEMVSEHKLHGRFSSMEAKETLCFSKISTQSRPAPLLGGTKR